MQVRITLVGLLALLGTAWASLEQQPRRLQGREDVSDSTSNITDDNTLTPSQTTTSDAQTTSTTVRATTPTTSTTTYLTTNSAANMTTGTAANTTQNNSLTKTPTPATTPTPKPTPATEKVPDCGLCISIASPTAPVQSEAYEITGMVKLSVSNCTDLGSETGRAAIGRALANASAVQESWVSLESLQCSGRRLADRRLRFLAADVDVNVDYRISIPADSSVTAASVQKSIQQESQATLGQKFLAELSSVGLNMTLRVSEIGPTTVSLVATTSTTEATTTTSTAATTTSSTAATGKGEVTGDNDSQGGSGGGGEVIIIIVVGVLAGITVLVGLPVCIVFFRKSQYGRRAAGVRELEMQADHFDNQVKELMNQVDIYEGKYKKASEQQEAAVLSARESHTKYMEDWQRLEQEVQDFFLQVYTPELELRQAQKTVVREPATSRYWPVMPATSEKEVKSQCGILKSLTKNLDAISQNFRALVETAFPLGIPEIPTPGFLLTSTYVPDSPDVERDAEMLRPLAHPLLGKIVIKPYGVLGVDESKGKIAARSSIPAVIVDPAGWAFISKSGNAKGAAGASGAIYDWIGLRSGTATGRFPPEVLAHFKAAQEAEVETFAKFHHYGDGMDVIHTIGPKIMDVYKSLPELTRTYVNVLDEFCKCIDSESQQSNAVPQHVLRLLPVSSGVFLRNKKLEKHMPQLTWTALSLAFGALPAAQQEDLRTSVIEVCIFEKNKIPLYEESLKDKLKLVPGDSLKLDDVRRTPTSSSSSVPDKRGYDWIRTKNGPQDRMDRLACFLSTAGAVHHRSYTLPDGRAVTLHMETMLKGTHLLKSSVIGSHKPATASQRKIIHHADMTVMEAAMLQENQGKRTLAVNAASAYQVGGGVMSGGRHALEETWCTMSTLLPSLLAMRSQARRSAEGAAGLRSLQHIPVDGCIISPDVEIFRGTSARGYPFEAMPTKLSGVCSMAMFNMNARVSDSPVDAPQEFAEYCRQVRQKFRSVLEGVKEVNAAVLVCPDVGCGVFENDPEVVGSLLGEAIREFPANLEVVVTGKLEFFDAAKLAAEAAPDDALRENKEPVPAAFRPRARVSTNSWSLPMAAEGAKAEPTPPAPASKSGQTAAVPPKSGDAGALASAPAKAGASAKAPAAAEASQEPKTSALAPVVKSAGWSAGPAAPPPAKASAPAEVKPAKASAPAEAKPAKAAGRAEAKPSAKGGGKGKEKPARVRHDI